MESPGVGHTSLSERLEPAGQWILEQGKQGPGA